MCLMMYASRDVPLPLVPWQDERPDFHVVALNEESRIVKKHFLSPHVRYIGSYDGCSCAFNFGREYPENREEVEEFELAEQSRARLLDYIKKHRVQQIYTCEIGDEGKDIADRKAILSDDLLNEGFCFGQRELVTLLRIGEPIAPEARR
jgi:hypothetical protein